MAYLREKGAPIVIKADGLAAGIVAMTLEASGSRPYTRCRRVTPSW
ncbi:hypothetical protein ACNKHQ_23765 [Shigella flexneri]